MARQRQQQKGLGQFAVLKVGGVRATQHSTNTGGMKALAVCLTERETGNYNLIRPCYAWHCLLVCVLGARDKCGVVVVV